MSKWNLVENRKQLLNQAPAHFRYLAALPQINDHLIKDSIDKNTTFRCAVHFGQFDDFVHSDFDGDAWKFHEFGESHF